MTHVPLPPPGAIEAFEAAARRGSLKAAAAELAVTPSAVSHRVRDLERSLGVELFERRGRGVGLTPAGERLAEAATAAFRLLRAAVAELTAHPEERPVTVACSPSFAVRWLVPRLDELKRAHPGLEVWISADDRGEDPAVRGLDAAIHYGPANQGLLGERLADENVFPVARPDLAETLHESADLAGHTLLHDDAHRGRPEKAGWRAWLEAAGVADVDPEAGQRFSHAHLALDAAAAGQGVALARTSLAERDLAEGRLAAPFALEVPTGLSYHFVVGKDRPSVRLLEAWLRSAFAHRRAG